ncbi:hypothetical protein [Sporosarcina sp. D27]|uniref:hypothetical protein n=1 Tax=Sporosarcina sp. D27 TaxID=1382305 RepID=UPI0012DCE782|nr:hypothetical protein [Sporosarcina sp. D27]
MMKQEEIVTDLSEITLVSIPSACVLYIIAALFLGSPKYVFFSSIKFNKLNFILFLCLYYLGAFVQTLAYFIIGLPTTALIIEKTLLSESDIFVIMMITLCIILVIDIHYKFYSKLENFFDRSVQKLQKGELSKLQEPEQELNKIYDLEKLYAIIATITTILVIGDAAASIAFPLEVPKGSNRFQAYLDSTSYIYMMIFVSTTLVYLKELIKGGIKRKNVVGDQFKL